MRHGDQYALEGRGADEVSVRRGGMRSLFMPSPTSYKLHMSRFPTCLGGYRMWTFNNPDTLAVLLLYLLVSIVIFVITAGPCEGKCLVG